MKKIFANITLCVALLLCFSSCHQGSSDYYDDEEFLELFWKLIGYVEKFDSGIVTFYRRLEEILRCGGICQAKCYPLSTG